MTDVMVITTSAIGAAALVDRSALPWIATVVHEASTVRP